MKMLTIICRNTLEGEIRRLLNDLKVDGYTVTSGLGGKGQTGSVSEHNWMERNVSFMTALEDEQVTALADAVKQFSPRHRVDYSFELLAVAEEHNRRFQ